MYSKKLKLFLSDSLFSAGTAKCVRFRMAHSGWKKRHLLENKSLDGYPRVPFGTKVNIAKT